MVKGYWKATALTVYSNLIQCCVYQVKSFFSFLLLDRYQKTSDTFKDLNDKIVHSQA